MDKIKIIINFPNKNIFELDLKDINSYKKVPDWAYLDKYACPGIFEYGPEVTYCSLACQLKDVAEFFKNIKSYEKGTLLVKGINEEDIKVAEDAQTMFLNVFWVIALNSDCLIRKKYDHFFNSFSIPVNTYRFLELMNYELSLINSFNPLTKSKFLNQISDFLRVIYRFFDCLRMRMVDATSHGDDSLRNGMILFEDILMLIKNDIDSSLQELKKR